MADNNEQIPTEFEGEEEDVYLNPEDVMEVIDIDDETDMDQVADKLMDVLDTNRNNSEESDEEMEVLQESGDEIQPTISFEKHTDSVCCSAISPCGKMAVTGGEDDTAYLWRIEDGEVLLRCEGHEDTVISVSFSNNGKYFATADMKGIIKVWSVKKSNLFRTFETGTDISIMIFEHVLVCGTEDSQIWVWNVASEECKVLCADKRTLSEESSVGALSFSKDGKSIIAGFSNGAINVFDIKSEQRHIMDERSWHSEEVISIDTHMDGKRFLTGGKDGFVKLHILPDFSEGGGRYLYDVCKVDESNEDPSVSVEAVSFCPTNENLVIIGKLSGEVLVYDITRQRVRHTFVFPEGVTRISMSSVSSRAYLACLDGVTRVVDVLGGELTHRLMGHSLTALDVCSDREDYVILTVSEDKTAKVFQIPSKT